jgi:hypothetical protein
MQAYGRDEAIKFPGKEQMNIKGDGEKLQMWWEGERSDPNKKKERQKSKKMIKDELNQMDDNN